MNFFHPLSAVQVRQTDIPGAGQNLSLPFPWGRCGPVSPNPLLLTQILPERKLCLPVVPANNHTETLRHHQGLRFNGVSKLRSQYIRW